MARHESPVSTPAGSEETGTDVELSRVRVGIAEQAVADGGTVLATSGLGSCVGIALYDADAGVGGLVHAMLPNEAEAADGPPEKFVDAGVDGLREALVEAGANPTNLEARIAGGADMLDFGDDDDTIGQRNVETAHARLQAADIPLVDEHVGGTTGRSLAFDTDTGRLSVRTRDGTIEL